MCYGGELSNITVISITAHFKAEMLAHAAARFRSQAAAFTGLGGAPAGSGSPNDRSKSLLNHPSDEEVSETNQRNKAISSSAITRALSDAQAGELYTVKNQFVMPSSIFFWTFKVSDT